MLLCCIYCFFVDPVHKSCIEPWQRGEVSPWKRGGCNGKKKKKSVLFAPYWVPCAPYTGGCLEMKKTLTGEGRSSQNSNFPGSDALTEKQIGKVKASRRMGCLWYACPCHRHSSTSECYRNHSPRRIERGHAADVSPDTQPALPARRLSSLNTRRQKSLWKMPVSDTASQMYFLPALIRSRWDPVDPR